MGPSASHRVSECRLCARCATHSRRALDAPKALDRRKASSCTATTRTASSPTAYSPSSSRRRAPDQPTLSPCFHRRPPAPARPPCMLFSFAGRGWRRTALAARSSPSRALCCMCARVACSARRDRTGAYGTSALVGTGRPTHRGIGRGVREEMEGTATVSRPQRRRLRGRPGGKASRAHSGGPCERCWQGNLVWIGDLLRAQGRALRASAATAVRRPVWASHGLGFGRARCRSSAESVHGSGSYRCAVHLARSHSNAEVPQSSTEYPVRCSALLCSAPQASLESLDEACRSEYSPMLAPAHASP